LTVTDEAAIEQEQEKIVANLEQEAASYRPKSKQTLHQALDAFRAWMESKHREVGTGTLKPYGKRMMVNIATLKAHQADTPLSKFTLKVIEDMEDYWQRRPATKRSKVAAIDTAKGEIKTIRKFLNWLHKEENFNWRLPADYVVRRLAIKPTAEELARKANPEQVKRYKRDELIVLWKFATPLERLLICLAMNCGFGAAEVKSLFRDEIQKPDEDAKYQTHYIKRIRRKTLVYGEWVLWDITVKAIDWFETIRRPKSSDPHFLLTKKGTPLVSRNGNNNPSIGNWWNALLNRITAVEENKGFRRLSFNKLRKTSGNYIRRIADGETMRVFHSRGKPVQDDEHSEVYSNKNFGRVHKAIRIMRRKLESVFASVETPFPPKCR